MVHYGTIEFWPEWADNLTRWNHLMLVTNSSINIVIYTAKVGLGNNVKFAANSC